MARRQRSQRASRKSGALIWSTLINDSVAILPGATKTGSDIVTDSDWTVVGGQERATIMRVRGWFSVGIDPAGGLIGQDPCFAYIGVYDKDELSQSAALADTYSEEDIMATYGHQFPYSNISQTSPTTWDQEVDIKAMRKIRKGQELRFVMTNQSALQVRISLVIRALIKRS